MKKNNTILLIGCCGSGKTWVCKQLIKEFNLNLNAQIKSFYFRTNKKVQTACVIYLFRP